jgi:hypothetical protein
MIARFTVLLPFSLTIPSGESLQPYEIQRDPYRIKIYPPLQANINYAELGMCSPLSLGEVILKLQPAPAKTTDMVLISNAPTIQANLLQIDFMKEDFDRSPSLDPERQLDTGEPPARFAFEIANDLIARLRAVGRGCELQSLNPDASFWRLDYLDDKGTILPKNPLAPKVRRRGSRPFRWRVAAVTQKVWLEAQNLPANFAPHIWDTLILHAEKVIPDVNAAVALANAALEAFSKWLLDELAQRAMLPTGLWAWINRRGHFLKEPSVDDRFDPLLRAFAGRSLKEEPILWKGYKDLRNARNSFSHAGKPTIGDREVTVEVATSLVNEAQQIVDWCENLLPETVHRPKTTETLDLFFPINQEGFPTLPDSDSPAPD